MQDGQEPLSVTGNKHSVAVAAPGGDLIGSVQFNAYVRLRSAHSLVLRDHSPAVIRAIVHSLTVRSFSIRECDDVAVHRLSVAAVRRRPSEPCS